MQATNHNPITDALLTTATQVHHDRLLRAVAEFPKYRLLSNGDLLNTQTGDIYSTVGKSGCTCADFTGRVAKLRERMTTEGVATPCCCKHHAIRRLLAGEAVKVGNSVFRAKKK